MISGHLTHWYDTIDQGHDQGILTNQEHEEATKHLDTIMTILDTAHNRNHDD